MTVLRSTRSDGRLSPGASDVRDAAVLAWERKLLVLVNALRRGEGLVPLGRVHVEVKRRPLDPMRTARALCRQHLGPYPGGEDMSRLEQLAVGAIDAAPLIAVAGVLGVLPFLRSAGAAVATVAGKVLRAPDAAPVLPIVAGAAKESIMRYSLTTGVWKAIKSFLLVLGGVALTGSLDAIAGSAELRAMFGGVPVIGTLLSGAFYGAITMLRNWLKVKRIFPFN